MPERIQRRRTKGWRLPENTVYVGRPTMWGNPFVVGSGWMTWAALACGYRADRAGQTQAAVALYRAWLQGKPVEMGPIGRDPAASGFEFENGEYATVDQMCMGIARFGMSISTDGPAEREVPEIGELRGKNLACWCPLVDADGERVPCHAEVLLELANEPAWVNGASDGTS